MLESYKVRIPLIVNSHEVSKQVCSFKTKFFSSIFVCFITHCRKSLQLAMSYLEDGVRTLIQLVLWESSLSSRKNHGVDIRLSWGIKETIQRRLLRKTTKRFFGLKLRIQAAVWTLRLSEAHEELCIRFWRIFCLFCLFLNITSLQFSGIDPSKWDSVFESFEQADPSTTRTYVF